MILQTPFHADHVGTFLRPEKLKIAQFDFYAGKISREMLTEIENEVIANLVAKIKELGFHTITDGEFRRTSKHADFMSAFDGICNQSLTGKISLEKTHPFVEHFKFIKQFEDTNTVAKLTIPAPAQILAQTITSSAKENTEKFYTDINDLVYDIANGYKKFIRDIFSAGCRNLQIEDCTCGMLSDQNATQIFGTTPAGLKNIQEQFLIINNLSIESCPDALTINTHICRKNYHSAYTASGTYYSVAETLFARENVGAFFLEFDDEKTESFSSLAKVSKHKKVVLGLVTTKSHELEEKSKIIKKIHEAEKYVPLENICLSPRCGFESCETDGEITESEQWATMQLVQEIAKEVWG